MVLRKIKQFLGMGGEKDNGRSDTDVVVQQDTSEPDTETEAAVKGVDETDDAGAADPVEDEKEDEDEAVAAGTDASASTESLVDETDDEAPESSAEPAEAAGPGEDEESTDIEEAEPEDEPDTTDGAPVDDIKGIGPAYSERLGEVGINNVSELADADPAELAERVTVAEKTVAKWVDRAKDYGN